jgi:hypothetical protein
MDARIPGPPRLAARRGTLRALSPGYLRTRELRFFFILQLHRIDVSRRFTVSYRFLPFPTVRSSTTAPRTINEPD